MCYIFVLIYLPNIFQSNSGFSDESHLNNYVHSSMQSLRICLTLVLDGAIFQIWLKYLFGTVNYIFWHIILFYFFNEKLNIKKKKKKKKKGVKKANPCFLIIWVGRKRANKNYFLLGLMSILDLSSNFIWKLWKITVGNYIRMLVIF